MVFQAEIKEVTYEFSVVDDTGKSRSNDLSLGGEILVVVEYGDPDDADNEPYTRRFILPASLTVDQIQTMIEDFGRQIKNARVRVGELSIYVGGVIPIDPPVEE